MNKLFHAESPAMQFLYKLSDMIILNLLTVVCSLPILTAGAAQAGLYCAISRLQSSGGSAFFDFFKGFAANFKRATALWLLWLAAAGILIFSALLYLSMEKLGILILVALLLFLLPMALLWVLSFPWLMPLQVCFENSFAGTVKNALGYGFSHPFASLGMTVLSLLPVLLLVLLPSAFMELLSLWFILWLSLAAYCNMRIAKKIFAKPAAEDSVCPEES